MIGVDGLDGRKGDSQVRQMGELLEKARRERDEVAEVLQHAAMWWEGISAIRDETGRVISLGKDYEPSWLKPARAALAKARGEG